MKEMDKKKDRWREMEEKESSQKLLGTLFLPPPQKLELIGLTGLFASPMSEVFSSPCL